MKKTLKGKVQKRSNTRNCNHLFSENSTYSQSKRLNCFGKKRGSESRTKMIPHSSIKLLNGSKKTSPTMTLKRTRKSPLQEKTTDRKKKPIKGKNLNTVLKKSHSNIQLVSKTKKKIQMISSSVVNSLHQKQHKPNRLTTGRQTVSFVKSSYVETNPKRSNSKRKSEDHHITSPGSTNNLQSYCLDLCSKMKDLNQQKGDKTKAQRVKKSSRVRRHHKLSRLLMN